MNDLRNPYIAGAPVVEASMFFGREDVFSWIERSLGGKYVDHILVLHGQRRVGKTSVLKQIPNFLPEQYIQVFFDLQGRTNTSLDRFVWWLAREIARTLKQEREISIPRPDRARFRADPEYLINAFLPDLKPKLGDHVLLLTFDEFDTLDRPEIRETLAEPLIETLRQLMEIDWLNFIFSIGSSGDKLENMRASYTNFFKSALYRKISFLTEADCNRLITKPVEGLIRYEPKAVARITEITSGHPYFTQLICHELFSLCQKTGARQIQPAAVDSVLEDVIERGTVNLKFVWDEASDLEKWILAGLARMAEEKRTVQDLGELLRQQRVRFSESDLNAALIHLRDKDVITQDNRFIIHLMQMWLQANRPMDRVREELVEVNPIANRYIEIGDEYRELGQAPEALDSYQQALNVDPGNLKAQSSIALVHLEGHAYQEAIQAFNLSLQIDDEDVVSRTGICEAHLALGDQARENGETEAAAGYYREILVINPAHTDARQRLADIYVEKAEIHFTAGEDEQALRAFQQAMDYTPEDDRLADRYEEVLAQKKAKAVAEWLAKADRAVARQRWDEAAGYVEEAIKIDPDNADLHTKRAEVKDAPRQHKIRAYKQEAEQALRRGNFDKAIIAIETAVMLAPEDRALTEWLETTRSDQLTAQLNLFKDQADRAIAAGDWDTAISARAEALKLSPDDAVLQKSLADTKAAKHQAQLDACQIQAEEAVQAGNWDAAITALEGYLKLEPGETKVQAEIDEIREKKRQSQLAEYKAQADSAAQAENWDQAVTARENYLALQPDDPAEAEEALQQARKYAKMAADYTDAQEAIRKKRYRRAIELLQGIIAQDPTYKSTSRLLVEAVEANKAVPIWRRAWVLWAFGALLVIALGVIFGPQLWKRISTEFQTTPFPTGEALAEVEPTSEASVSLEPEEVENRLAGVLATTADTPATFEEDFSTPKAYWGDVNLNWVPTLSEAVSDGVFKLMIQGQGEESSGDGFRLDEMSGHDFVLQFDFTPVEVVDRAFIQVRWHLLGEDDGYQFRLFMDGYWDFNLTKDGLEVKDTLAHGIKPAITDQPHTLQVISKSGHTGVYLDGGSLVTQAVDPNMGEATDITAHAMDTFHVEIDNLKFWNLDDGELMGNEVAAVDPTATPIVESTPLTPDTPTPQSSLSNSVQAYISTNDPTFEDDFSAKDSEWGTLVEVDGQEHLVEDYIQNGVLTFNTYDMRIGPTNRDFCFPSSGIFNASNFAIRYKYYSKRISQDPDSNPGLGWKFRQSAANESNYYYFNVHYAGDYQLVYRDTGVFERLEEGYISDRVGDLSEVQIIAVEDQVVIYIDGSLVASFENQPVSGEINVFCMEDFQTLILDDVQFWNLDGVELPSPGSSVQPDEGETSSQPDNEIPRPASLLGKVQLFETTITSLDWSLPEDNSVETWVVATSGNQMLILDKAYNQNLYDETAQILSVNFENPGGGRGLTLGCDDGSLKYYTNLGRYWSKLYELDGLEGRGAITSVQYGSSTSYHDGVEGGDGAAATDTGWLAVWNSLGDTGTLIFRKEIDEGPVYSMDWNVENRQLLTVSENQGLQVWNTATGGRLLKMDFQSRSASWSPDGRYIALEDHSESPMLVVLQSGAVKAQAELPAGANQVAWSPDGRLIATGGVDGIIRLWRGSDENMSIPSLELIREFQQDTEITAIAWSSDSQQLVTGDVAGYIWYWDVDK